MVPAQVRQCPLCGYAFKADGSDLEVDPNAELHKVDKKEFKIVADYSKTKYARMDVSKVNDWATLFKIEKARGYQHGWAYHKGKEKGLPIRRRA